MVRMQQGEKNKTKQKTFYIFSKFSLTTYYVPIPTEHLLCASHCRRDSTEAAASTLHNKWPRTHLLWYPQDPAGVRRVNLQAGLARAKWVGLRNLHLAQRGMELASCPCFKGCSHRTAGAGECPFRAQKALPLTSISSSASLLPMSLYFTVQQCRSFQNLPRCFTSRCVFCFLSLECLYSVLPSGELLLTLQNPVQTSLPPGSTMAFSPR